MIRPLTLLLAVALAGCQAAPAPRAESRASAVSGGVGYLIFNAPINDRTRDLFVQDIGRLVADGARTIHLGISSPGGEVDAAQGFVDEMARQHATGVEFDAYNIGLVASAASYIFLQAQKRFAAPRSAFVFHAAFVTGGGPADAQTLRDSADKLDAYERIVRATLKAHTRLSDSEALTYVRRTVLLNAEDARRDGVVDGIAAYTAPRGTGAWIIAATPPARPSARPTPMPPPQPN